MNLSLLNHSSTEENTQELCDTLENSFILSPNTKKLEEEINKYYELKLKENKQIKNCVINTLNYITDNIKKVNGAIKEAESFKTEDLAVIGSEKTISKGFTEELNENEKNYINYTYSNEISRKKYNDEQNIKNSKSTVLLDSSIFSSQNKEGQTESKNKLLEEVIKEFSKTKTSIVGAEIENKYQQENYISEISSYSITELENDTNENNNNKKENKSIFSYISCSPTPTLTKHVYLDESTKKIVLTTSRFFENETEALKSSSMNKSPEKLLGSIYKTESSSDKNNNNQIENVNNEVDELFTYKVISKKEEKKGISHTKESKKFIDSEEVNKTYYQNNENDNEKSHNDEFSEKKETKKKSVEVIESRNKIEKQKKTSTQIIAKNAIEQVNNLINKQTQNDINRNSIGDGKLLQPITKFFPINKTTNKISSTSENISVSEFSSNSVKEKQRKYLTSYELKRVQNNKIKKAQKSLDLINVFEKQTNEKSLPIKGRLDDILSLNATQGNSTNIKSNKSIIDTAKDRASQYLNSQNRYLSQYDEDSDRIERTQTQFPNVYNFNDISRNSSQDNNKIKLIQNSNKNNNLRIITEEIKNNEFSSTSLLPSQIVQNEDSTSFVLNPLLINKERHSISISKAAKQFQLENDQNKEESDSIIPICSILDSLKKIPKSVSLKQSVVEKNSTSPKIRTKVKKIYFNEPVFYPSSQESIEVQGIENDEKNDYVETNVEKELGYLLSNNKVTNSSQNKNPISVEEKDFEKIPRLNFENYTIFQLKEIMEKLKKKYNGRESAIAYLKNFVKTFKGTIPYIPLTKWQLLSKSERENVSKTIFDWIIQSPWHVLISTFIPIDEKRLLHDLKKAGIKINLPILKGYLESEGVILAQISDNQKKSDEKKSKTRRNTDSDSENSDQVSKSDDYINNVFEKLNYVPKEPIIDEYIITNKNLKTKQYTLDSFINDKKTY